MNLIFCFISSHLGLVEASEVVGLRDEEIFPWAGSWLNTEMCGLPMSPVAVAGLEGGQVGVPGRLVAGVDVLALT